MSLFMDILGGLTLWSTGLATGVCIVVVRKHPRDVPMRTALRWMIVLSLAALYMSVKP